MRLLLAVSGGIDSMYLAYRASEFYPEASFAVAHCNFGLRGQESDGDEEFVREWCAKAGLDCFVTRFDTLGRAAERGESVEMAARALRYGRFSELCREEGFEAVVVAHNANDNAETMLLNLLRGTGTRGIRGMAPESHRTDGLIVLRPMLEISRVEITGWMRERGYAWREDSSNSESVVKRNILRNEVFPIFEKINPSFLQTLSADMKRFAMTDDIAEDCFQSCGIAAGADVIPLDTLLATEHWEYLLWRLLERCRLSGPTFDKLVGLLTRYKECRRGTITMSGKTFESPTHILRISGKKLIITESR